MINYDSKIQSNIELMAKNVKVYVAIGNFIAFKQGSNVGGLGANSD